LMGLLDECSSQDTIETLRQKLASKYQPQFEDKLALTAARSTELEKQRKTKITVTLLDESNTPFLVCDTLKEGIKWPVDATVTSAQRVIAPFPSDFLHQQPPNCYQRSSASSRRKQTNSSSRHRFCFHLDVCPPI